MATQRTHSVRTLAFVFLIVFFPPVAQAQQDLAPLRNWPAPMYWQPSQSEELNKQVRAEANRAAAVSPASDVGTQAQTPVNSLVFVGMNPCRVVDTRGGTGTFGGPNLIGGTGRTFPIQSSPTCSIPSIAQAYSFNMTVVPNGFLDYITAWPTGQPQPLASTLNGYVNTVIANAAIVPAGTSGSVDIYASQNTHLIIDINGYYAPQTGITLAPGTADGPSLSFAADAGTGIFSSGPGTLNVATMGTSRLSVGQSGDVNISGNAFVGLAMGVGTTTPTARLAVRGNGTDVLVGSAGCGSPTAAIGFGTMSGCTDFALGGDVSATGNAGIYINRPTGRGIHFRENNASDQMTIAPGGNVGIGTTTPALGKLHVEGGSNTGVYGGGSIGVYGFSHSGVGVYGESNTGFAGYFQGKVRVGSKLEVDSTLDVRDSSNTGLRVQTDTPGGRVASFGGFGNFEIDAEGIAGGRLLVTQGGLVGIGTSAPTAKLSVNGTANKPGGGSWDSFSDVRLKNIKATFTRGLTAVMRLQPLRYEYKSDNVLGIQSPGEHVGFSAQAVQQVIPEAVTENDKGYLLVNNDPIMWTMLNAIKEQQAQIGEQRERITEQQEQNRKLEARLAALEKLLSGKTSTAGDQ